MCRIFALFDFYVFYISRAHFSASLKQIPKVTTTFLSTLCEILQENQRKAQVYNNQALLMQHWFTHDNLISIQHYCLLSCRLYHVFFGVQGQWSKLLFLVSKFLQAFSIPHEATQLLLACLATQQATRDDRQAFFLKLKSIKGKDIHKINC